MSNTHLKIKTVSVAVKDYGAATEAFNYLYGVRQWSHGVFCVSMKYEYVLLCECVLINYNCCHSTAAEKIVESTQTSEMWAAVQACQGKILI